MSGETRYQRIAREQAERQAARADKVRAEQRSQERRARAERKAQNAAKRERRYLENITRD